MVTLQVTTKNVKRLRRWKERIEKNKKEKFLRKGK